MAHVVKFSRRTTRKHFAARGQRHVASLSIVAIAFLAGFVAFSYFPAAPQRGEVARGASFTMCSRPPHDNCVIDGDTFYLEGQSIRIADIDAPETHPSRCAYEARLGERATERLLALLNEGPFELVKSEMRDEDRY